MLLHELALGSVASAPDLDSLLLHDGRWSRAELNDAVVAMTGALATVAPPGGRIGILAERRPDVVALALAIPAAGRVAVLLDPGLSPDRLTARLDAARVTAVVGTAEGLGRSAPGAPSALAERTSVGLDPGAGDISLKSLLAAPAPTAKLQGDPSAPAWILFPSRTADRATELSADDLRATVARLAAAHPLDDDDVYLHGSPLDQASVVHLLHALHRGRPVVLPRRAEAREITQLVESHGVTTLIAPPSVLRSLVDHGDQTDDREALLGGVRTVTCTAAAPPALLADLAARGVAVEVHDATGLVAVAGPGRNR